MKEKGLHAHSNGWAAFFSISGGFSFGFANGIISGILGETRWKDCSAIELSFLATSIVYGLAVGSLFCGYFTDKFGRKKIAALSSLLSFVFAVVMAFVPNVWGITALRIVQGIFVGCISNVAPICTTEFSTEKLRGRLVSLYQVSVVIGIMISYGLNIPFDFVNDGWRYEFAFTGIGPLIMCIGSFIAPESPVWLEKNQRSVIRSQNSEDRDANDSANRIVDTGSKPSDALIEASGQHHYSTFSPTASPAIPYSPNLDNSFSTSQLLDSHRTSESDSPSAESSTISNEAPQSSSTNNSYSTSLHAQKEEIVEQNELPNGENSSPTFNNENNKIEIVASSSGVIIQGNSISFKPISTETAENVANNSDSNKKSEDPMNNAHLAQDNVYSSEISDSSRTCSFLTKLLRNPRSFIVAVVFSMCLQLTGANVIASYTPLILAAAGVETRLQSLLFTLAISAWNSLSVLLSLLFVDSVGRKPLLMMGSGAASVGLLIMVLAFLLQTSSTAHIVMSIVAIVIFLLGFQGGIGPTYYVVVNEIFPASIAGKAVSMSMVINWICNIIIVQLYLPLSQAIGEGYVFLIICIICVLFFLFVLFVVRETKGKVRPVDIETEMDGKHLNDESRKLDEENIINEEKKNHSEKMVAQPVMKSY